MKPLRFHRAARAEIRAAAEHYAGIHPELGGQYYDAMDDLIRDIRRQPGPPGWAQRRRPPNTQ